MAENTTSPQGHRNVFVIGANGYIGSAVCRSFVRAGWRTFGMVRKPESAKDLLEMEAIPVVGDVNHLDFLQALFTQATAFDVIVGCTGPLPGYAEHFEHLIVLLKRLAEKSNENSVRPLVLLSSGCKDYGMTSLHGARDLAPHTEESPLVSDGRLRERTESTGRIFDYHDLFDAAVIRPTCVYGYSSSFYGLIIDYAADQAAKGAKSLTIPEDPNNIMHAVHIDDCADAYLALAEHHNRSQIAGQAFNISSHRYETTREVGQALAVAFKFEQGIEFVPCEQAPAGYSEGLRFTFAFPQWVGSDKIRKLTGWRDRRALFTEETEVYVRSYEAAKTAEHGNVSSIKKLVASAIEPAVKIK